MKTRTGLIAGLLGLALTVAAYGAEWETDFTKASEKARRQGKYLLVDFSGSDWCGWCIRLKKEVFSQPEFQDYARNNLVCVRLDFPRRKPQAPALKKQNETLARKYNIRGFPTVLILAPNGETVGKTGYQPGGARAYVAHLRGIIGQHAPAGKALD